MTNCKHVRVINLHKFAKKFCNIYLCNNLAVSQWPCKHQYSALLYCEVAYILMGLFITKDQTHDETHI